MTYRPSEPIEHIVKKALSEEPKNIRDDLHLLAYCWVLAEFGELTHPKALEQLGKIYTYLLKHPHPETILREKRKWVDEHPVEAEKYESTKELRREIQGGEVPLPIEKMTKEEEVPMEVEIPKLLDWDHQREKLKELKNSLGKKEEP